MRSAARRCAPTISPLAERAAETAVANGAVLEAGQDAARAGADREWQGRRRPRAMRATWSPTPTSDVCDAPRVRDDAGGHRARRGSARDAHAVRNGQDRDPRAPCARSACSTSTPAISMPRTTRFEELLSTGAQSYEALYYLGVIAERRKDPERAVRFYLACRAAITPAGAATRGADEGRAIGHRGRARAARRTRALAAAVRSRCRLGEGRARCRIAGRRQAGAAQVYDEGLAALSGRRRPAHGPGIPLRAHRRAGRRDPRTARAAGRTAGRRDAAERARLHARRQRPRSRRSALADHGRARADARQCGGARQHGLAAVPARASTPRRSNTCERARASSAATRDRPAHRRSAVGDRASRTPRARPGRRGSSGIPTTKSCASGSSARGPEHRRRCHRAWPAHVSRALVCWRLLLAGCATAPVDRRRRPAARAPIPTTLSQWIAKGRIALAAQGEGGSGSFVWQQRSERTELAVARAARRGRAQIVTDGDIAAVRRRPKAARSTATRRARRWSNASARELPLADMRYWMLGVPAPERGRAPCSAADAVRVPRIPAARLGVSYQEFRPVAGWSLPARLNAHARRTCASGSSSTTGSCRRRDRPPCTAAGPDDVTRR